MERYQNVSYFLGVAPRVGTTMIAQSVAQTLSGSGLKTLFIVCNALSGLNYIPEENVQSLDVLRNQLQKELATPEEIRSLLLRRENMDILPCAKSITGRRLFYPSDMEFLLKLIQKEYDYIVIDCDTLERGLTIGAIQSAQKGFHILTQQKGVVSAHKQQEEEQILAPLQPEETHFITNKVIESNALLLLDEIQQILGKKCLTVPYTNYGWQSEYDKRTLLSFHDANYTEAICNIANRITGKAVTVQKRKWFGRKA